MDSCAKDQVLEEVGTPGLQLHSRSEDLEGFGEAERISSAINQLRDDLSRLEAYLIHLKQQKQREIDLRFRVEQEMQKLEEQSVRINLLGRWIEMEILKFDRAARQVARIQGSAQRSSGKQCKPLVMNQHETSSIWSIHCSEVPVLIRQQSQFLLTSRAMDLCGTELVEATQKSGK
ncbi:MAG: hypothetical protein ACFBSF_18840 [Leptolyngbyaceae cyanobacterium]